MHSFGHLAQNSVFRHLALGEKLCLWSPRAERKNFVFRHLAHRTARGDQWRSFSVSARWRKTEFSARWPKLCTYFWDIFGFPGQEKPSWAKRVSPLNSSMKTTTFKTNWYFYHRIPLTSFKSTLRIWLIQTWWRKNVGRIPECDLFLNFIPRLPKGAMQLNHHIKVVFRKSPCKIA